MEIVLAFVLFGRALELRFGIGGGKVASEAEHGGDYVDLTSHHPIGFGPNPEEQEDDDE